MKRFIVASLLLLSAGAMADTVYLQKFQDSGYTPPEYFQTFDCKIYADRVEITRTFGGNTPVTSIETRAATLSDSIATLIESAANEPLVADTTLCDAPGTRITAFPGEKSEASDLLLLAHSSCSFDGTRKGASSTTLLNIANGLCGNL